MTPPISSLGKFADTSRFSGIFGNSGPKTPQGKAIAARNATTHGLFARDVVLPSLGEDPRGYDTLYNALCEQIDPRNLIERHYVEVIADASWRLRRVHRWHAQVYEDQSLTEDERMGKLDRVLRHETALHRQIDKSVRLLGRDVPALFEGRARKEALAHLGQTERSCRTDLSADQDVADRTHDNLQCLSLPTGYDPVQFDNVCPVSIPGTVDTVPVAPAETKKCQNELLSTLEETNEEETNKEAGSDAEEGAWQKEALRQRDRAWEAAHPLKPRQKVGRLQQTGSKKRGSTLPLLSSVMLPLKKGRRTLEPSLLAAHSNWRKIANT